MKEIFFLTNVPCNNSYRKKAGAVYNNLMDESIFLIKDKNCNVQTNISLEIVMRNLNCINIVMSYIVPAQ